MDRQIGAGGDFLIRAGCWRLRTGLAGKGLVATEAVED